MVAIRNGFVDRLEPNEVFVFGSNTAGRHGAGAARMAKDRFGAKWGVGQGRTGQSYALPTASYEASRHGAAAFPPLDLDQIKAGLDQLRADAESDPASAFLLTRIGMGRSGYSEQQIRPLIEAAQLPSNVKPYWEWESGGGGVNPLLFGGATAAKKYSDGRNYHGNDWEATRYLSNYAELKSPVTYGGVAFPSVEQAYVAAKFNDPAMSQFIAEVGPGTDHYGNASMPAQVARNLGRAKSQYAARDWAAAGFTGEVKPLRSGWNEMKVDVMRDLVRQKFENNPEFREFLLSTGDRQLIEHTTGWGDRVWGMVDPLANRKGADAQVERLEGENHLGKLLMETRASYRSAPEQPAAVVNPTGQQVADGVQLKLDLEGQQTQEDPRRKAGDLLPWLLAAGGTGLAAYALAEELNRGNPGAQVPAQLV